VVDWPIRSRTSGVQPAARFRVVRTGPAPRRDLLIRLLEISIYLAAPSAPHQALTVDRIGQPELESASELGNRTTNLRAPLPMLSSGSDHSKRTRNLWREAYSALGDDDKGKERLHKLNDILKQEIGKPNIKIRSEDGYKQLQTLISKRAQSLAASKSSEKVGKICNNMLRIEELVAAGANVGGPYVAIPAAALFLAFSVCILTVFRRLNTHEIRFIKYISPRRNRCLS
jgi:hypothetical protein